MNKQKNRSWIAIALLAVSLTLVASGCSNESNSPATNASNSGVSSPENSPSGSPSSDDTATDDMEESPSDSPSTDETASKDPTDGASVSPAGSESQVSPEPRPRSGGKPAQENPGPRSGGKPAQPAATEETGVNPYEVAGIDDPKKFETFFADVQALVGADNKEKLAEYVQYPMHFFEGDKKDAPIKDSKAFIAAYDRIFTKEIKEMLKTQTLKDLFVNYKGISAGSGAIWFSVDEKGKIAIMTVNQSPTS
ncbi:hypothetical protein [Cohnella lupini]|uniref:Uncharacterized protein n=1 Tax=Cohnella lupini TaxID=1294267 RepID=A0A3D9IT12_9BACL|nr:hypothetical protein [Cohnella lupini]RED64787.1 hypothetical protein DFP95_102208 [Cohnella lupini]